MSFDIKPIPTVYNGHKFRSRLEARWAVAFDVAKIEWVYEMEAFDLGGGVNYLPDFWLPQVKMWAEVKPCDFSETEQEKCRRLAIGTKCPVLMLDGMPSMENFWAWEPCIKEPDQFSECPHPEGAHPVDYYIFHAKNYHLTERRFYCVYSGNEPWSKDGGEQNFVHPPHTDSVDAAREKRFW